MSSSNTSDAVITAGNGDSEGSFVSSFIKHKSYPSYELRDKQQRIANTIESFDYTAIHSLSSLTSPIQLNGSIGKSVPGHNITDLGGITGTKGTSLHNDKKINNNSNFNVISRDGCQFTSPAKMRWLLLRQLSGINR
ncbi:hypothetical protein NADFUDRAFT_47704 [Nadsonia fulvescens var. elongata DSM 6958]|uniref:Uncharacterized protein n=1 Tax=Nadsonia fulvescens var. elongata DSM 6958 TaxID=857566 RepID=A0A1E3PGB9_9ASCO|nr:hypothetical protein NADFUDRAFT_47704 [Nadsonia fulvescens var. elongata DSM 6958]